MCIQGNPKLREGHGQLETEIDVRRLGAAESMSVVFPWISSPHGSLGLAHHRHAYCLWELSDANTQTLSGPLTLIRSLWYLEGQMVIVGIRRPGLTPLPIAGWLALGYEVLISVIANSAKMLSNSDFQQLKVKYVNDVFYYKHFPKRDYVRQIRHISFRIFWICGSSSLCS